MGVPKSAFEKAKKLYADPVMLGRALGYPDLTDMHGEWMRDILAGSGDLTLQAHRGSYKTTCLCICIALMMVRYRSRNIIFIRKTDTDIEEVIKNVQRVIESPVYKAMTKALSGGSDIVIKSANKSEITLSCYCAPRGSAQLLGIGIGGSLTGKHADIVITDDIVNLKDRVSRAEREHTKAVYQELQNVRNRGGRIINMGTPWHKDDAFSIMPPAKRYDFYSTGLISKEKLEELRKSMSPSLFAANYELRHIAQENALFSEAPKFTSDASMLRDGISHIDAAYGGDDYTAFTCGNRIGDTIYMYGRLYHAHVGTVTDAILSDADRLMCMPIYLETNGDKGMLAKDILRKGYPAKPYSEKQNKFFKISSCLRKWWSSIVWIEGTDPEYLSQILDYTEQAEHDDAPDSAACICRILDRHCGDIEYA